MFRLHELPSLDAAGRLNVIVDTPRGSHNKYKYDEEHGVFRLSRILPAGRLQSAAAFAILKRAMRDFEKSARRIP